MKASAVAAGILASAVLVGGVVLYIHLTPADASTALQRGQYKRAAEMLYEQVQQNNVSATTALGNLYYVGLGVHQDYAEAASLYSQAAFAGSSSAQINLGHMYRDGLGVTSDRLLAYAWFNQARGNGSKVGQVYMSAMLHEHMLTYHLIQQLRTQYATINSFPKLH